MGRSTRFLGARVLRSGRRVWTGPTTENLSDGKKSHLSNDVMHVLADRTKTVVGFANEGDPLLDLKNKANEAVGCDSLKLRKKTGRRASKVDENSTWFDSKLSMDVDEGVCEEKGNEVGKIEEKEVGEIVDKMYGIVYSRKRKKGNEQEDVQYLRRKKCRSTCSNESLHEKSVFDALNVSKGERKSRIKLYIVVGSCGSRRGSFSGSGSSYSVISSLLHSILRYMRRADIRLWSLCAFVCSEPIVRVFDVHGIRVLQNFNAAGESGSCLITGVKSSIPVFSVDFAALPFVFLHLHSTLSLCSARWFYFPRTDLSSSEDVGEELNSVNKYSLSKPLKRDKIGCEFMVGTGTTVVALPALGVNMFGGQSVHIKSGRKIQERRNSLRKRGRRPISVVQKSDGVPSSKILRPRENDIGNSSQVSTHQLRNSNRRKVQSDVNELKHTSLELQEKIVAGSCSANILVNEPKHTSPELPQNIGTGSCSANILVNELKPTSPELPQKTGAGSCSANILVIESDKCHRVEGAVTALELSESNQWCLMVRIDGVKRHIITAQKVMRPCSSNRITHNILWSMDDYLKLEFPNRQDWLIFKELYKECFERNLQVPVQSFIPVPRVNEGESYGKINCLPFARPDCYISVKDDELARALKKKTANYDMDSDDEEWLHKFNSVHHAESEVDEDLSADRFELIIDAFEKACHCNPDVFTNVEAAYSIFPDLERKVVEALYGHWILKRKLKRSALVRVFQFYQPRKSQLISKFNSRKKRSFKRQGSQAGRGKQRNFLHAFVVEQDAIEQKNILKVQEAKARLDRLESLASQKRRRAQELFENADLAAYKAVMALRISEAAQFSESTHVAASYILD
ncbi:hypothetical protein Leryth_003904 [Lithospermum erythrorhizon]|nr:hypothetical protein Leryth_003904 [Lithospermum erythrorhizon]